MEREEGTEQACGSWQEAPRHTWGTKPCWLPIPATLATGRSWRPQTGLRLPREVWGGPGIRVQSWGILTSPVGPVCVGHTSKEEISRDTEEPTVWAVRDWLGDGPPLVRSPANHSSGPVDGLLHPSSPVSLILTALLSSRHYYYLRLTDGDTEAQRGSGTSSGSLGQQAAELEPNTGHVTQERRLSLLLLLLSSSSSSSSPSSSSSSSPSSSS